MVYRQSTSKKILRITMGMAIIGGIVIIGTTYTARKYYFDNLKPISASETAITVNIEKGSSVTEISKTLFDKKLIRNEWAFTQYVRNHGLTEKILAGTYSLTPSESVQSIVKILTEGRIQSNLFTVRPGRRIDQLKQDFINAGFNDNQVDAAFQPAQYENHPALVDKPAGASLEGYLYPESFQKTGDTNPKLIITKSLDEMQKRLTPEVRAAIAREGLSVHEGLTLASIITQEVSNTNDMAQVSQVFFKRLHTDMVLGSDVTAFYGSVKAGREPSLNYDSPYNTHLHKGLPPGPISNVTQESLDALVHPASTDWLYFVAGDDGKTYFARTNDEHEQNVHDHCKKLCSL